MKYLLVAGVGAFAYYLWQQQQAQQRLLVPTQSQRIQVQVPGGGWITYDPAQPNQQAVQAGQIW